MTQPYECPLRVQKYFSPTTDCCAGHVSLSLFPWIEQYSVTDLRSYFSNPSTLCIKKSTTFSSSAFPALSPIPRKVRACPVGTYQYPAIEQATDIQNHHVCGFRYSLFDSKRRCVMWGIPYGSSTPRMANRKPTVSQRRIMQSGVNLKKLLMRGIRNLRYPHVSYLYMRSCPEAVINCVLQCISIFFSASSCF